MASHYGGGSNGKDQRSRGPGNGTKNINQTTNLEVYAQRIHFEGVPPKKRSRIFGPVGKPGQMLPHPPVLYRGCKNTALIYVGSFNPPHYGHLALLHHALQHGGEDLNIVAAVVVPVDDKDLANKFSGASRPLLFSKEQRVQLFRSTPKLPFNVWVYDRETTEWDRTRRRLAGMARADGFDLTFMILSGPDHMDASTHHDPRHLGCRETIVTDVCRPVDFVFEGSHRPSPLPSFTDWATLTSVLDNDKLREGLRKKIQAMQNNKTGHEDFDLDEQVNRSLAKGLDEMDGIFVSQYIGTGKKENGTFRVRFLSCRFGDRQRYEQKPDVSSTLIRKIITTCSEKCLESELGRYALSPALLASFARAIPDRGQRETVAAKKAAISSHERSGW